MRLTTHQRDRLLCWANEHHIGARRPEFVIPDRDNVYLRRWFVLRRGVHHRRLHEHAEQRYGLCPADGDVIEQAAEDLGRRYWPNAYIHAFYRSDDDRALHDHPWPWMTVMLSGRYIEHVPLRRSRPAGETFGRLRQPGDVVVRARASRPHRLELVDVPVITLFVTAPKLREWGFWCEHGWVHHQDYLLHGCSGS